MPPPDATGARPPPRSGRFANRLLVALALVAVVAIVAGLGAAQAVRPTPVGASSSMVLVVATATSLVAAVLASWVISRHLSAPIEKLADAADAVASGAYGVTFPETPDSRELRRLGDAFARMSSRLSDTEASRTRLLSDLAHEIRTPLATLEAYIDALEDGVVEPDATSWSTMRDQVSRLRRLTADLRETAAAEEHALNLQLRATDLADVASTAVEAVIPRYRAKGIEIDLVTATGRRAVLVRADSDRLKQVMATLLDNALRHTSPEGHVIVEVGVEGHSAVVRVSDDGEGIPTDQLEAVFARFHRADSSRRTADGSGSGLGLTIARAIVSDHGGTITAASPATRGPAAGQRGATFTIRLPLPTRAAGRAPGSGPSPKAG